MKRFLALILAVAMSAMWLLLPAQAVLTSGTAGENITWSFDETTKQITVTGTGPMDLGDYPQWSDLSSKVYSVVIEEGVTSVDRRAFANFQKLHTVTLSTSVKTIEEYAFDGCWQLKNISLEHITRIESMAFRRCSNLVELIVPSGITEIAHGAFSMCIRLQKVVFHENVKTISDYAFNGCTALTSIRIPDNVTTINPFAFNGCRSLETVELGSGITVLSNSVFNSCTKLESIRIPDSITSISTNAFCDCTVLKEVYLGAGVAEIAPEAFRGCPMLKAFTLSDKNPNLSVDQGVLYTKDRKELVQFPCGFTGAYTVLPETTLIRDYAGYECGITALTIPGNVKTVGRDAFCWCEDLVTLRLSEGLEQLQAGCFEYTPIQKVEIPASVTKIGQMAFSGCVEMKQMIIYGDPPAIDHAFPYVNFTVFYPKKTSQWLKAHDLYGGLPSWELQCTKHSYVGGACSRCGVSDPGAGELAGTVIVAGNDYAVTNVQLMAEGQTEPLRTYTAPVGEYLFPEIVPGKYVLRINAEGYVGREYTVEVASELVIQDICLQRVGDINGDGNVNIGDVLSIYAHVRGTALLEGQALASADFNGDGSINMGDVLNLYAKIRGAS